VNGDSESAARRAGAASGRRIPVVVVLVGLLVAAIAAGDRRVKPDAGVREPTVAAALPAAAVRSSAWYCAGGPVGPGASGDRVTISDLGSRQVRVAVGVMVARRAVAERLLTVAARSSRTLRVAQFSRTPGAALVVQPLGGNVVVEQAFAVNGDVAMAPCATRTSSSWYFAAGSTVGGAQQWLSLLNPFAVDAVVDVEAYTENGLRSPGSLQGLVVPAGSRLAVRVDRTVAEQRTVAVGVHARNDAGIVATEALIRSRSGNLADASLSLGAFTPASTWMFSDNRSRTGARQQLVLADPGDVDATVRVSVVADVSAVIEPQVVRVPATSAVTVDLGTVPAGVTYTLVVHSVVPIVAETRDGYVGEFPGLVSEVGATAPARRWAFAGGPFTATGLGGGAPRVSTGSQLAIVMNVGASAKDIAGVRAALVRDSHVKRFHLVTQTDALAHFQRAERNNPALLASTTKEMLPASFDVALTSSLSMGRLRFLFLRLAGVDTVVSLASQRPPVVDEVVVLNPNTRAVQVTVTPTAGGSTLSAPGMAHLVVVPGRQVTISLVSLDRMGVAVLVSATGPVVAERFTAGKWGVTRSPGASGS
jgi:hypothetical protein